MKKYTVVGFLSEKGQPVEVVPSTWLINDETCVWPPEKNPKMLILSCSEPKDTWSQYPVKVYGKSSMPQLKFFKYQL